MTARPNHGHSYTNCSPAVDLDVARVDWLNDPDGAQNAREARARRAVRQSHFTHAVADVHDQLVTAAREGRLPPHLSIRSFSPMANEATFVVDVGASSSGRPCCGIERVLVRMSHHETPGNGGVRPNVCEMVPVFHRPIPRYAPARTCGPADEAVAMLADLTL